jgi:hypothetical protein
MAHTPHHQNKYMWAYIQISRAGASTNNTVGVRMHEKGDPMKFIIRIENGDPYQMVNMVENSEPKIINSELIDIIIRPGNSNPLKIING